MKTNKLGFVLLILVLFVTPLFCVKNSLFNSGEHKSIGMLKSQLYANSKAKQLDLDMAKCFYLPDEWVFWYRMDELGCSNVTEEDRYNNAWVMAYNTDVASVIDKPVMATITDFTETPSQMRRFEYTYTANSQDQPATITSSYYNNNQWMLDKRQTYTYNNYGGITQVNIEEYYNGGGWVLIEKANCVSNMDRLAEVTLQVYNFDSMDWENNWHMVLAWTGSQVNEVAEQDWTGSSWDNSRKQVFSYGEDDELTRITEYWWSADYSTWKEDYRTTFTFVSAFTSEELIEAYDSFGNWISEWKGVWSYNLYGYPTSQLGYSWENDVWGLSERMSFNYNGSAVQDDNSPGIPLVINNYPNPFVGTTTVSYKLPQSGQTELSIYNIRGQLVRMLVNESLLSGLHSVTWNGKDDNGNALASGMYLCRISSAGKQETHKMLLMK